MQKKLSGLYVITDANLIAPKKFTTNVRKALEGGARIIQYRDKSNHHELRWQQAQAVVSLCREFNAVSIINDDIELAKIVNADGVHIGMDDESIELTRSQLGDDKIIGASCYADLDRAATAISASANYIAFGSIYSSPTKPQASVAGIEILCQAKKQFNVPIVAIGGIQPANMPELINTGVDSVAVISGIFGKEDIKIAAQQYSHFFEN